MLRPCPRCNRHVAAIELTCVFCDAPLAAVQPRITHVGRLSRAMVFAGAIAVAPLGCGGPKLHYESLPTPNVTDSKGEVKGRLMRHDGKPAANTTITLYGEALRTIDRRGSINAETDANGYFQFKDVPLGNYWLGRSGLQSPRFDVRAGKAAVFELELDEPTPIRHMAKPYGAPPARRRVV